MRRSPRTSRSLVAAACLLAAGTLSSFASTAHAQVGTAITYQGLLERNGVKVTTATDMRCTLFDAATGGAAVGNVVTLNAQQVSNGLFNVALDFGVNPYTADAARWVQIEVRNPAGSGSFVPMGERQKLTPSPFSLATRGINVDATGKVGVGTSSPLAALSVGAGSFADANVAIQTSTTGVNTSRWIGVNKNGAYGLLMGFDESAAGNYAAIRQVTGDPLNFVVNNTTVAMSLLSNGNVGVGGGPATSDTKFTIHQGYTPLGSQRTNLFLSQPQCGWGTGAEFTNYRYIKTDACSNNEGFFKQFNVAPGGVSIGYPNTPAYNSADAMYVNGFVGIGTNTPSHKLTVQGDTNTMRLIGPTGSFLWNARLNFGDADYVRISENDDDFLDFGARNGVRSANTFSAPAKNFRIDHPSDPQNKILNHGCIESDQYVNLYRGNATIGNDGGVWIQLPAWMNDLNTDFSYQLTSVGAAQPNLFVAVEVNNRNQFRVAGGQPGAKVSWQVTGVRHDAYVRAHPLVVEQVKTGSEVGTYISPSSYGIFTQEELAKYGTK